MPELFADLPRRERAARTGLRTRRAMITVFAAVAISGLANLFGQQATTVSASARAATLSVDAPDRVRGGLFFQTRIDIEAAVDIDTPQLVLDPEVLEGMQVSSIEPAPASEDSRDGRPVLEFEPIAAGETFRVWLQFQVDPTTNGRRAYGFELTDDTDPIARVDRDLLVLP